MTPLHGSLADCQKQVQGITQLKEGKAWAKNAKAEESKDNLTTEMHKKTKNSEAKERSAGRPRVDIKTLLLLHAFLNYGQVACSNGNASAVCPNTVHSRESWSTGDRPSFSGVLDAGHRAEELGVFSAGFSFYLCLMTASFFHLEMGMFVLCHCMLEVWLFFSPVEVLTVKRFPWIADEPELQISTIVIVRRIVDFWNWIVLWGQGVKGNNLKWCVQISSWQEVELWLLTSIVHVVMSTVP